MNYLLFSYSHSFREHNIHLIITKGDREDQKQMITTMLNSNGSKVMRITIIIIIGECNKNNDDDNNCSDTIMVMTIIIILISMTIVMIIEQYSSIDDKNDNNYSDRHDDSYKGDYNNDTCDCNSDNMIWMISIALINSYNRLIHSSITVIN